MSGPYSLTIIRRDKTARVIRDLSPEALADEIQRIHPHGGVPDADILRYNVYDIRMSEK